MIPFAAASGAAGEHRPPSLCPSHVGRLSPPPSAVPPYVVSRPHNAPQRRLFSSRRHTTSAAGPRPCPCGKTSALRENEAQREAWWCGYVVRTDRKPCRRGRSQEMRALCGHVLVDVERKDVATGGTVLQRGKRRGGKPF